MQIGGDGGLPVVNRFSRRLLPALLVVVAAVGRLAVAGRLPAGTRVVACLTGGPHDRWAAEPGAGIAPGRVTGTIPPTVSALSAAVSEGLSDAPEDPS